MQGYYETRRDGRSTVLLVDKSDVAEIIQALSARQFKHRTIKSITTRPYKGRQYDGNKVIWVVEG